MRHPARFLCLICVLAGSCGSRALTTPFLEVTVANLPANTKTEQVDATFAGETKTKINQSGVLDRFTVSLPADARGPLSLQVAAKNDSNCFVAKGMVSVVIAANDLRGVFTFDRDDTFAVGDNITTGVTWLRGNGMNWVPINHTGIDYNWNALWGLSSPNLYVVGEMGRTVSNNPFNIPAPANANALYGVYGTSSTTMTAVGVGKTILRLNGTSWMAITPPTGTGFPVLRAIHGTAAATPIMYTVGDSGTVWSFDGVTWNVEMFPVQTQLNGVFVFAVNELYVVGQGRLVYHKKP